MTTKKNAPYKISQRASRQSKYRIYGRNKNDVVVPIGHERPVHINFGTPWGVGRVLAQTDGGVSIPSHVAAKRKAKRNIRNRIARLFRRNHE